MNKRNSPRSAVSTYWGEPDPKPGTFDEEISFTPRALDPEPKRYAADRVFDEVGAQILRGEAVPDTVLPPEKELSAMFGVSKVIVRQAIHRLEAAGLVSAHQGGRTLVRDPWEKATMEIIALFYRLAPEAMEDDPIRRSVLEKQYLQGLSLVEVFARRAGRGERKDIVSFVEARVVRSAADLSALEAAFWTKVAEGSGNHVLAAEVRYWYALAARPKMPERGSAADRAAFYLELARRMRDDDDALGYYIKALAPLMRSLDIAKESKQTKQTKKGRHS